MEGGAVVDDDRDKFENVDRDERSVLVAGFKKKCAVLDLLWDVNVPPEA